ncbi:MAG TPA: MOSC domain-containing protein [Marmoricola sp.]|nr:MOSC domain-containing protein [Marmoricola sp.]
MSAYLHSINVGKVQPAAFANLGRSAIEKRPLSTPVWCGRLGLVGDEIADRKHHGGPDQAVYAFAREDLDRWEAQLNVELRSGVFGENLTTLGIDVNEAEVGERWQIGDAVVEVASVRIPCNDFKGWLGLHGVDNRGWVRRFTAVGRPGPYLRVVQEGEIRAGDRIEVVHQPGHGVTVSTMFRALTTEKELLPELLKVKGLERKARAKAETYVAADNQPGGVVTEK